SDNEIYTPKGNVRLNFVDHGENFANGENGMDKLTDKVKQIYDTYANENTYFDRIALVGCDTSRIRQGLTRNFAKMIYDNIPALKTTEITGRKGDMQINPDGTKTMETGGEKMIYQWNGDLNVITRQTKESKRVGEILEGLKLGGANSKGSPDTDNIPNTLNSDQVDTETVVGQGVFKTAYNFKDRPNLLVLLLTSGFEASEIEEEIKHLKKLDSLGIKTPKFYKKITFIDKSNTTKHGLVVQKIKGAQDIMLSYKSLIPKGDSLLKILNNSSNQTLEDIQHLQKIFAKNATLSISDFQGLIAEDGQLYIMDPQGIDLSEKEHLDQLNALQALKQVILKHHERFTDKTLNHITYIDKKLWDSPDGVLKQKILNDVEGKNNKVIVIHDFATGEKEIFHKPNDSQNLVFETVEVITDDSNKQRVDLRKDSLDFLKTQSWEESDKSVFRVNTPEGYEALNLKSNDKNKHNIILSIGEDKVTRDAAKALFDKHPNTSVLVTLNRQGKLVFPRGKAFTPDSSVRLNIVGHSEKLEEVGATKLANYTDQLVRRYKMDSAGSHAYLNRAALVGCKNKALSENYAKELYTRRYLRDTSVTGRLGDIHVNEDGSKTMNEKDQKIIHRWDYLRERSTWTTQSSKNIAKVLDHLKLGLDGETALNIPDSLTHEDIGRPINEGSTKVAYTLKNHPDLLFLQLEENPGESDYIEQLKNEVEWINKFREMGIKTPKYFKVLSIIDEAGQEHHGILVERIHDSFMVKPGWEPLKEERITHKTLVDIQTLLQQFASNPDLSIVDLQMLVGRDGQLYVMDPANSDSSSVEPPHYMHDSLQKFRTEGIRDLRKWRNTSINVLKAFNQNKGVHAIFVSKEMLERDPEFEESLLDKAQKQQDLVVMGY
ncbi:hypothetical protein AZO1586R_2278, partial [Bathymodiolus azoricus thioautotrophic gill symbiont]